MAGAGAAQRRAAGSHVLSRRVRQRAWPIVDAPRRGARDLRSMDTAQHEPVQVWLMLLAQWTEDARTRGAKSATAYLKAHRALSECTDTFTHPCETVRLKGIGDSIANRLEVEYEKWCQTHDRPLPERRVYAVTDPSPCQTPPRRARIVRTNRHVAQDKRVYSGSSIRRTWDSSRIVHKGHR